MHRILIADACKSSLVMTSEALKDCFIGVEVAIAGSGEEFVEKVLEFKPDLCIVDFDLPDADGPSVVQFTKQYYTGPMLITAYPEPEAIKFIESELVFHRDARRWLQKPIKAEVLTKMVESFLVKKERLEQRFQVKRVLADLCKPQRGRSSKDNLVKGEVINLSMSGGCLELGGKTLAERGESIQLNFIPKGKSKKTLELTEKIAPIKASVEWVDDDGRLGVKFANLTGAQKKNLEIFLSTFEPES